MKTLDFVNLVRRMREAQKMAARNVCSLDRRAARKLEGEVDQILKRIEPEKDKSQTHLSL